MEDENKTLQCELEEVMKLKAKSIEDKEALMKTLFAVSNPKK